MTSWALVYFRINRARSLNFTARICILIRNNTRTLPGIVLFYKRVVIFACGFNYVIARALSIPQSFKRHHYIPFISHQPTLCLYTRNVPL